jgi:ATP-dependent Clp protease ATP-binding subunit ClpA
VGELARRLEAKELKLELSPAADEFLAEVGYDPQFGARPLRRALQKHLEDALARHILAGDFVPGDTVAVDRKTNGAGGAPDGALTFRRKPPEASSGSSRAHV